MSETLERREHDQFSTSSHSAVSISAVPALVRFVPVDICLICRYTEVDSMSPYILLIRARFSSLKRQMAALKKNMGKFKLLMCTCVKKGGKI